MIEGLKVTVPTADLRALCVRRADHHRARAATYAEQVRNLTAAEVEGMDYTGGDPIRALKEKQIEHDELEQELRFVAGYLKEGEEYLLDDDALRKLGIVKRRW
ncbi:MAG: hypothetical protein ACOYOB_20295 [Myxococcota bacterium]|jgi:hypothetical protein